MEREKSDTYIREVTSHVKFPFDRRAVAKELREHMEDLYEDLLSQDIEEEQAAQLTVDYMGDSEEVGKEFARAAEILKDCGFRYYTVYRERKPVFLKP